MFSILHNIRGNQSRKLSIMLRVAMSEFALKCWAFLAREVATGRYRSAREVVRAGLRLLEGQETHMTALRAALAAGEESGEPGGV